jgi:hypothetical protein
MAEQNNHISRGPRDRTRVDVDQDWEVTWWSKGFGVTVAELKSAIEQVGPLIADLDRRLLVVKASA